MKEEWKVYKITYTNQYRTGTRTWEVSNLGRVKCNGEIVEPYMNGNYLGAGTFKIHRAVAELFIPNPDNKPFVDHINTDCLDNRACNLHWVTYKENNNNPLTKQHFSEAQRGKVLTAEHKRKIGEALKGRSRKPLSEEHKRKLSEVHKGKKFSEEHKRNLSESHKEYYRKKRGN